MIASDDPDGPPPPYQMAETELLLSGVTFDEDSLRRHLPASVSPVPECSGVIAAYLCGACYPFGPYTGLYISADVEGFDAPDGSRGRVMLCCVYGPDPRPAALMSRYVGFRAGVGRTSFERVAGGLAATTSTARGTVFSTEMKVGQSQVRAAGSINWVRRTAQGTTVVSGEPWVGDIAEATLSGAGLEAHLLHASVPDVTAYTSGSHITRASFAFIESPGSRSDDP